MTTLSEAISSGASRIIGYALLRMADDDDTMFRPEYLRDLAMAVEASARGDEIGAQLYLAPWRWPWPGSTVIAEEDEG